MQALGLTDYPIVIKKPMDLGTIAKRLDGGQYSSLPAFSDDINQVWVNAFIYNQVR